MHRKGSSKLATPSGLWQLAGHATMGVAMGLCLTLSLSLMNPSGTATLIEHAGIQDILVFVGSLVLTFGIGAGLSGAVFVLTEDD